MKSFAWRERLFETTRGQVLALLQLKNRTVNELSEELSLTDNAVRAHLISLERDGLVCRVGTEAGVRRPHAVYGVTPEAEHLFPRAYSSLLNHFLNAVAKRLDPRALNASLREVGRRIAREQPPLYAGQSTSERLKAALALLKTMGGSATVSQNGGKQVIRGQGCPFAAVTATHPEACLIAESLLSEIIGLPVTQHCLHGPKPSCCFEVAAKKPLP
jgi:predicted ArsR family transcriptional regulator